VNYNQREDFQIPFIFLRREPSLSLALSYAPISLTQKCISQLILFFNVFLIIKRNLVRLNRIIGLFFAIILADKRLRGFF